MSEVFVLIHVWMEEKIHVTQLNNFFLISETDWAVIYENVLLFVKSRSLTQQKKGNVTLHIKTTVL